MTGSLLQTHRIGDGEEEVGLVGETGDVDGARAESGDTELRARVALVLEIEVLAGSVANREGRTVLGGEVAGQARVDGLAGLLDGHVVLLGDLVDILLAHVADDLRGVGVIGGDDDEGLAVLLGEFEGLLDSLVKVDGLADLATGVGGMVLLIDGRALHLEEETLVTVLENVDGLLRHRGERGDVRRALRVIRAGSGLLKVAVLLRLGALPTNRHVALGKQAENRLILRSLGDLVQLGGVGRNDVALLLGVIDNRLALALTSANGLAERLRPTAQRDICAGLDNLLGDGTLAALLLQIVATLFFILWAVALTGLDVGRLDGRSGVLNLRGRDVARLLTRLLRLFQQRLLGGAVDIDGNRAVIRLGARRPGGTGGGRIRDVVWLALLIQGIVRVLAGDRQGIDALKETARALGVVARHRNLRIAHTIADEEDDVLGTRLADRVLHEFRLVAGEAAGATVGGDVTVGGAVGDLRIEIRLGAGGVVNGWAVTAGNGVIRGAIRGSAAGREDSREAKAEAHF